MRIGIMILFLLAASLFSQQDYFTKCASHNGVYVAIGMNKSGTYLNYYFAKMSKDSIKWTEVFRNNAGICDVRWLVDRFVIVGGDFMHAVHYSLTGELADWHEIPITQVYVCSRYGCDVPLREVRVLSTPTANKYLARCYAYLGGTQDPCGLDAGTYYFYYYSADSCKSWLQYDGADWGSANNAVEKSTLPKAAKAKVLATYDIRGRRVSGMARPGICFVTDGLITKKVFNPY
jgi:hypothetical protein